ncbi:MAG: glycosyltransferase family 1 protein [Planctomycetes bacterium]|nr:glycosyltransferase family 1 protein [Planctomycetota bacterium]
MRIAIVAEVFLPKVDGVVIRTMNLIRHLLEQGDEILVVTPSSMDRGECPVPILEFPSFPFLTYPEYRIGLPDERLTSTLREFQPDLVHYLNPFAFGFRCHDWLERSGSHFPSLFSFHTVYGEFVKRYPLIRPLSGLLWWLMRDYHNQADLNLTVSALMLNELRARGFQRVELWPPAVNCELFNPRQASFQMRERLTCGHPDERLLVTVSRLAPEKNVSFLCEVIDRLPGTRLAIIGDGPDRAELERRFAGTKTAVFGYLQGAELATAYASADAFVYASETETMGNVVLEAMASGLGVVVPRAGGIPSLVNHQETGLLYSPRDPVDAVSAIRQLLDDADFNARISHAARQTVEDWGWNRSIAHVREHYLATIEMCRRTGGVPRERRWCGPVLTQMLVTAFRALACVAGQRITSGMTSVIPATAPGIHYQEMLPTQGEIHGLRGNLART